MNYKTLIAILSNCFIVYLFIQALLNPADNINFIYGYGIFLFVAEFLALHSSMMLSGKTNNKTAFFMIFVYAILIISFSVALHTIYPALIFMLSLVAKVLAPTAPSKPKARKIKLDNAPIMHFIIFMSSVFLTPLAGLIAIIMFPFPDAVYAQRPVGSSGLFIDMPQSLLAWGIIYYSALVIWRVVLFLKRKG